jgi:hypothetical protein
MTDETTTTETADGSAPAVIIAGNAKAPRKTRQPKPTGTPKPRRSHFGRRPHIRDLPGERRFTSSRMIEDWRVIYISVLAFLVFSGLAVWCWLDPSVNEYEGLATGFASASLVFPIFELLGLRRRLVVGDGWMARGAGHRWVTIELSQVTQIRQKRQPKLGFGDMRTVLLFEDPQPVAFEVRGAELAEGASETIVGMLSLKTHLDDAARYLLPAAWVELRGTPAMSSLPPLPGAAGAGGGGGGGAAPGAPKAPGMPKAPKAPKAPTLKAPKAPKTPKGPSMKAPSLPKF